MAKFLNAFSGNRLEEEMKALQASRETVRASRRKMLGALAATGAAVAATGMVGCSDAGPLKATSTTSTQPSVGDVLNFALNLEYLEASFYLYATSGSGIPAANVGSNPGTVSGGARISFQNNFVSAAATQLATDELEHVIFLQQTIQGMGGTAVALPTINLAANGTVNSDATFVAAARQLEAVGVSAYIGGGQYLTSNTQVLTAAAQILDTEAQHAGLLRQLCLGLGVTSAAVDSMDTPPTNSAIFNTDPSTGYTPVRTTSQVLQIVYAAAGKTGVSSGGFFPNGLNGNIKVS